MVRHSKGERARALTSETCARRAASATARASRHTYSPLGPETIFPAAFAHGFLDGSE